MCGITGLCSFAGLKSGSETTLKQMIQILHHRGPDETGMYIDNFTGLGHARLSIIDLSGGSQPIHNEDKSLWIIFNGEIYNYPELRQVLQKKGHSFYTTSDTEVILHLFEEMGVECVNELNGQFAFAIWNSNSHELFLARDRVGIRPLHYTFVNNTFYFASEVKSLFTVSEVKREIEPAALDQIFTFWTTIPGTTVFHNIHELKPGHCLLLTESKKQTKQFWDIPYYERDDRFNTITPAKLSEEILALLTDAVNIRLRADVPVGSYLSGGLDSSGITSLIVNNFNKDVRTFGIRFEEEAFDEGDFQNLMVSHLGVDHTECVATNNLIASTFQKIIWHCETPLLRTAPTPLFLLSDIVRKNGFKVVLTGEGADEVFGGYNIFREALVRNFWSRQPDSQSRAALVGQLYPHIFKNNQLTKTLQAFFGQDLHDTGNPFFSHSVRWKNTSKIKTFLSQDMVDAIGSFNCIDQLKETLPPDFEKRGMLAKAQYIEMKLFLSNYLLSSQGDRMAMANSLEIRLPYLDFRVIDYMAKVPPIWKILGLNEKHILKKTFHGILPEKIVARPKHPYRAPLQQTLLNKKSGSTILDCLSDESVTQSRIFDTKKVSFLLKKLLSGKSTSEVEGMALIGIVSTQFLYKQFIGSFTQDFTASFTPDIVYDRRNHE